jgi:tetratricopeptide (TPR) repeat protein
LRRFITSIDTTASRTWRTMDAHLALEHGDTARALRRLEANALSPDRLEFAGDPGAVRTLAWADLLTRLGRRREAIEIYGYLDSLSARLAHPALHVRSFAERGALYQQLGDTAQAITMYERFIDAWEDADESLQPAVARARAAVAALRREPAGIER